MVKKSGNRFEIRVKPSTGTPDNPEPLVKSLGPHRAHLARSDSRGVRYARDMDGNYTIVCTERDLLGNVLNAVFASGFMPVQNGAQPALSVKPASLFQLAAQL